MYLTAYKTALFLSFGLILASTGLTQASPEIKMYVYYEASGPGLEMDAYGTSLIKDNKLKDKALIKLGKIDNLKKLILVWSGEVADETTDIKNIQLTTAQGKTIPVKADFIRQKYSTGLLYSAFADITKHYDGPGRYTIEGIKSHTIKQDVFSVAGVGIIKITNNDTLKEQRKVTVYTDLLVLSPGQMHNMPLSHEQGETLTTILFIGGHAIAGNASANLLNNKSISGGEDWDGSAGYHWDVDVFDDINNKLELNNKTVLTFDPVLQWIYPIAIGCVYKKGEKE